MHLWNHRTGARIRGYKGHSSEVRALAAFKANDRFVSGGGDKRVYLWDVTRDTPVRQWQGHDGAVNAVALAGDEQVVVTGSYDQSVRFWDARARSTRCLQAERLARDSVTSLALSSGPHVIAGSVDGSVYTLDPRAGSLAQDNVGAAITSVATPDDGMYVAAACTDSCVRLLERRTGRQLASYRDHRHADFQLECALLCHDAVVAVGSEDGAPHRELRLWTLACLPAGAAALHSAACARPRPDHARAGKIYMYDVLSKEAIATVSAHTGVVSSLCPVAATNGLLSAGADGKIHYWETA